MFDVGCSMFAPLRMNPTIAIIGAGALGGYYGARLAQHGHDIHFLLRSDYDYVREHGLCIRSIAGDFSLTPGQLRVYNDPAAMPKVDLAVVTLKSTENHHFARLIPPLLHETTAILTLQNGLGNEEDLAKLFGAQRVLGGIAFACINRTGPGVIEHLDYGHINLGEFDGSARSARADAIAALFNASGVKTTVLNDLRYGRWEKLVWNIPFNGLGAMLERTTDRLIDTDQGVAIVTAVMREVVAAAKVDGVTLPADLPAKMIHITRKVGAYRTSMQLDREAGRALEVEALIGRPLRIAQGAGAAAPLMELLYFALAAPTA
jgi:2-dehydropantoate 2-reductase